MDKKLESFADRILGELRGINHKLGSLTGHPIKNDEKAVAPKETTKQENDECGRVCSKREPTTDHAEKTKYGWYNPLYWWRVAKSSNRREVLESIGILFAIGYAIVTFLQWLDSRRALHASQRPWVYASGVEITHIYSADAKQPNMPFDVDLALTLKNSGNSVAVKGAAMAYLYPGFGKGGSLTLASRPMAGVTHGTLIMPWGSPPSNTNEAEIWDKECSEVDRFVASAPKNQLWQTGFILVPGADSRSVATAPNGGVTEENMKANHFLVYGCIAYSDGFNISHHTRFCFVGRDSPDHPKADLMACANSEAAD
jgi:hypothetical protein